MTPSITLVANVHVSKTEALDALSGLLARPVDYSDPSHAVISLENDVVISIEVPKFGEDLPLTLDLIGQRLDDVDLAAHSLMASTQEHLAWTLTVVGEG